MDEINKEETTPPEAAPTPEPTQAPPTGESPGTPKKRPLGFTILGWLSIIGAVFSAIAAILGITLFFVILSSGELAGAAMLIGGLLVVMPIVFSILYFVEGVGFLKLKKWLPPLLLITLILAIVIQTITIISNPAAYQVNFMNALLSDWFAMIIGALIVGATYKYKQIFVN